MINTVLSQFASSCSGGGFFGFPTWYKYLPGTTDPTNGLCSPQITGINDVWLIVAAIIEILLRLAALAAVLFVIFGGIQYITSEGEPDKTAKARKTLINALVGLVIAITSTVLVTFAAGKLVH